MKRHARLICALAAMVVGALLLAPGRNSPVIPKQSRGGFRFEVSVPSGLIARASNGRVYIALGRSAFPEPRLSIGQAGRSALPVLAADATAFGPGKTATLDRKSLIFPLESLDRLPAGEYVVQAVFHSNRDLNFPNAPGNLYSRPRRVHLDPSGTELVRLTLTEALPKDSQPEDTEYCRFIRLKSDLLSQFHGRPIYLRAGVIVPRGFEGARGSRYPLWITIGGYGSRYTSVLEEMAPGSEFQRRWVAESSPRIVRLQLDGAGPLGDPYQVNSANHGPYGDALLKELIPHVEKSFRCGGVASARYLSGGSTGGWVSLALQVFYPDHFNGCWSISPDPVDFRAMQMVDIYRDENAFVDARGEERPSKRRPNGPVEYTMRHDVQRENMLGFGDNYTMSGDQWGAWNATYSPRGKDGGPAPIWDASTGKIERAVAQHWSRYDLRRYLEDRWKEIGPKLQGKIHISMGEQDDYYLERAVHLLQESLSKVQPPFRGEIRFAPGRGHVWAAWSDQEIMRRIQQAYDASGKH